MICKQKSFLTSNHSSSFPFTLSLLKPTPPFYFQESPALEKAPPKASASPKSLVLDAAEVGDFPARYTVCAVQPHQFPVVGVYVDKRVIPGFKYRVRPLPSVGKSPTRMPCLFRGRALTLQSIGRGYARRFTFEADENSLNNNENYFWSDNRPEGFAFELEVISDGDKFTIFDANKEAQGTVEVTKLEVSFDDVVDGFSFVALGKTA